MDCGIVWVIKLFNRELRSELWVTASCFLKEQRLEDLILIWNFLFDRHVFGFICISCWYFYPELVSSTMNMCWNMLSEKLILFHLQGGFVLISILKLRNEFIWICFDYFLTTENACFKFFGEIHLDVWLYSKIIKTFFLYNCQSALVFI